MRHFKWYRNGIVLLVTINKGWYRLEMFKVKSQLASHNMSTLWSTYPQI